ncbi:MAG TPA: hypothetical protein VHV55_26185 [Pirellulales bacterium]|jgi:hypothetical protein|nr:hypothetical protein [Pirellulales bacterium]
MPILVVCPTCKAEFKVSEKFAGKSGPCPKCKAPIKIPTLEAEVKIHAPDTSDIPAAKGAGGKAAPKPGSLKPLMRQETKVRPVAAIGIVVAIAAAAVGAWVGGPTLVENGWLRGIALLAVSMPIVAAGYSFLRNDELEPYRGLPLLVRSGICALIYAGLWLAFSFVPPDMKRSTVNWFFLAPPFAVVGAITALATLDLDFGSGFSHFAFYVVITLALGFLAGLAMPWSGATL